MIANELRVEEAEDGGGQNEREKGGVLGEGDSEKEICVLNWVISEENEPPEKDAPVSRKRETHGCHTKGGHKVLAVSCHQPDIEWLTGDVSFPMLTTDGTPVLVIAFEWRHSVATPMRKTTLPRQTLESINTYKTSNFFIFLYLIYIIIFFWKLKKVRAWKVKKGTTVFSGMETTAFSRNLRSTGNTLRYCYAFEKSIKLFVLVFDLFS